MSEVKVNKITPTADCGTVTLGDSGDTVAIASGATLTSAGSITNSGTITNTGTISGGTITGTIGGVISWQTTVKTSNFTATAGEGYFVNTTSAAITVTLPASPSAGDIVGIKDYANTADTNKIVIGRNGEKIQGIENNFTISTEGLSIILIYVDSTKGWLSVGQAKASDISEQALYVTATGGTETTCGDFKIHTFTGPGTFCVSASGNSNGSNSVEYLVVAGGGAGGGCSGGGAGGGAGGLRFAAPSLAPLTYPGKPLAAPANLPVTVQGYPVTVGAGAANPGGAGGPGPGVPGSNSIFSTITSAGGGSAKTDPSPFPEADISGGSGAGSQSSNGGTTREAGSGNTPPVSPPQGNPGGRHHPYPAGSGGVPTINGGGGGGAIQTGGQNPEYGGDGAGFPTAFGSNGESCGSFRYYAGGGAGICRGGASGQPGGLGGGATSTGSAGGSTGDANTGGGGAGARGSNAGPISGGSGIVVIRYKFQN